MPTYRTPDVYIEEISVFPPSVAEVETAIPAFVGYTEKAQQLVAADLKNVPIRIKSLLEFESLFGRGPKIKVDEVIIDEANNFISTKIGSPYYLYDSLRLFFDNGGGKCYIVSVGDYSATVDRDALKAGVEALKKVDEPTILLFPDGATLSEDDLAAVQQSALSQCGKLGDRVAVLDTRSDDPLGRKFRDKIGINFLKYGAAYSPWLKVNYSKNVGFVEVKDKIKRGGSSVKLEDLTSDKDLLKLLKDATTAADPATAAAAKTAADNAQSKSDAARAAAKTADEAKAAADAAPADAAKAAAATAAKAAADAAKTAADSAKAEAETAKAAADAVKAEQNLLANFGMYANIIKGINNTLTTCPPSGGIAGVYALVDGQRGVWKAPANVSLTGVIEPTHKFDLADTDELNVDTVAGKSINAIRAFSGKGTLVWGARTLAGNDNEWRYVSVRRFFNMVEESVKKSTYWAVFEPNDANTWVKVRGMIENYLTQKWREGALAGATTKEAFFVKCGLGVTMNAQDILEGRMVVEIGMAVVRPAEFIILKFSHKLQTS